MDERPLFFFCLLCLSLPLSSEYSGGTTRNLEAIFLGRCFDYQELVRPYEQTFIDCSALWRSFVSAFSYKGPCDVTSADYQQYVNSALSSIPPDKALFWSGTFRIAHEYSETGKRFVTLEDTLLGYIQGGLTWCGQATSPGMNYTSCPSYDDCAPSASTAFWGTASARFASLTKGTVKLMLDGSNPKRPAYMSESYFGRFEMPNLSVDEVKMVTILVVHDIDQPYRETCKNGSLPLLQSALKNKGLPFTCVDNPRDVLHLLCVDDPTSLVCRLAKNIQQSITLVG